MTQWKDFLQTQGAVFLAAQAQTAEAPEHFGDLTAEFQSAKQQTIIADLSAEGLLAIQGQDAQTFLQGQFTNDIKLLHDGLSHYTGYCNAKGRLLAIFLAMQHGESYFLQTDASLLQSISKRLRMFVLRSKVEISDVSDNLVRIGLAGSQVEALLTKHFSAVPSEMHAVCWQEAAGLIRLPDALIEQQRVPRYQVLLPVDQAILLWQALSANTDKAQAARPVGQAVWEWLAIQAGIPSVTSTTQEAWVPQMLNMDMIGGISFKKGCYTGQEIVARTHYLGKVKRRTVIGSYRGDNAVQVGDDLHSSAGQESIGKVVRCVSLPDQSTAVLLEARAEHITDNSLRLHGVAVDIQPMPYAVDLQG